MGYKIFPSIPARYTKLAGLEGPFMYESGKVLYYDPAAGQYYDRDSDFYLEYEEADYHINYGARKTFEIIKTT